MKLFITQEILDETKEVLQRDFSYSQDEINNLTEKILSFAEVIEPTQKIDVIKEDPEDNKIIECAIASNSGFIITYDNHLLKLRVYKDIKIIKPSPFKYLTEILTKSVIFIYQL